MRKYYIDNLRSIFIMLLFPYHICMIYNTFGEAFYIHGKSVPLLTNFIIICAPWFMPTLFVLAGMSSYYALQRRSSKEYIKERLMKLLIPLIAGIVLIIPPQAYYADRFHNNYVGSYFNHYISFFTTFTDLTGYDGGFTPAHLWFMLYLFIISLIALPIMKRYNRGAKKIEGNKFSILKLILLFVIPYVSDGILDIEGKSLGNFFALFMLGYLLLSNEEVLNTLKKHRWVLLILAVFLTMINIGITSIAGEYADFTPKALALSALEHLLAWVSILAVIGIGQQILDFRNKVTDYFAKASFGIYLFHQTYIVIAAYYVLKVTDSVIGQIALILPMSLMLTFLTYEGFRRLSITRWLFGLKV